MTTSRNPGKAGIPMAPLIDWAEFISPPPPVDWVVEGILPAGVAGDIFGPPGAGKSSLIYSLAAHIASGKESWFGRKIRNGNVVVIGGEHSTTAAHWRSANRFVADAGLEPGHLFTETQLPLIKWHQGYVSDKTQQGWYYYAARQRANGSGHHPGGQAVLDRIAGLKPALVILDTILAVAEGCNLLDSPQQYQLARFLQDAATEIGSTVISISHTNQASSKEGIDRRLHYESRAGSNGAPGAFRWMAGLTHVKSEADCDALGGIIEYRNIKNRSIFAFGGSKNNEVRVDWTNESPAVFETMTDGKILLVASGEQVREAQEAAARNEENNKEDGLKKAKGKAATGNGNGYYAAKNGGGQYAGWEDY